MCGICGVVGLKVENQVLKRMTESLGHRGPDDSGIWTADNIALGHTRLSIIDLTRAGSQPMSSLDGRYMIVFNGEIYNYKELRKELEEEGQVFLSHSDTEVILVGYRRWGKSVTEKLRGMFAFAIWDNDQKQLFIARDRVGIKPLFYALLNNGLLFSSELKSILLYPGFPREIDSSAVSLYLNLGYVPGPMTIFKDIRALLPGSWLFWKGENPQIFQYWKPDFTKQHVELSEDDFVDELDAKLNDAVRSHLVSDVPVGAFLSGGIDSSLVAAIAQKQTSEVLHTYTIGFSDGQDERHYARVAADYIHSFHHECLITTDIVERLPQLLWHLEQPLFDNSIFPTYLVSKFAREDVKVVLSGDGGDEPFAGYEWTRYALSIPNFPKIWKPSGWKWAYQNGLGGFLKKLLHDAGQGGNARYIRRMSVSPSMVHWLCTDEFNLDQKNSLKINYLEDLLSHAPVRDSRDRFLFADLCLYLPEDILFKVDRMSMAHSLEVRVPLLDHQFLEWILKLPFSMRYHHGRGKYLLRKLAARYLPPLILKPRKQGFTIPIGMWIHGNLGDIIARLFSSNGFRQRNIVKPESALALLEMHKSKRYDFGHRIWSLVILEVWARIWLDGQNGTQSFSELLMEN